MTSLFKKNAKKRYYLHHKIRKLGYSLNTKDLSIHLSTSDDVQKVHKAVLTLQKVYGYSIQFRL